MATRKSRLTKAGLVDLGESELETARGGYSKAQHDIAMAVIGEGPKTTGNTAVSAEGWAGAGASES